MAIAPTGAIYKSLIFDGESSRDYGIYITGQAVYNAPERDVEMINIPGRNGSFALDKGRFQNIEVTYPAGIFADNEADFAQGISDFRNFLCSRNGYVRLTDDYNPDEYRMAVYKSGLDVSPTQLKAGEFNIVFDCKPQRFLTSGEEAITIGEWHETETASGEIASFEAKEGDAVKSLLADIEPIQSLNGYDKPWSGGAGKNKLPNTATSTTSNGITWTVNSDGSVTASGTATANSSLTLATITLPAGDYILNGCPSGGASNKYNITVAGMGSDIGSGFSFTMDGSTSKAIRAYVVSGQTVSNLKFYPMIRLSSVSDTTYEPYSNICPISGYDSVVVSRCGKNLANFVDGYSINAQGVVASYSGRCATVEPIKIDPSATYYVKRYGSTNTAMFMYAVFDGSTLARRVANIPNGTALDTSGGDKLYVCAYDGTVSGIQPMVTTDASAAYEPYQGNTYTIDLNGTRYGGTLDVASGVLTVDRVAVDMTAFANNWTVDQEHERCYVFLNDAKAPSAQPADIICNRFETASATEMYSKNAYGVGLSSGKALQFRISGVTDQSTTTVTTVTNYFANNPTQVVYKLATPTTVQLTAQEVELLVGLNQVWANSGDVEVEYGTAPNVVYNPTLFESSPMLEVEGYGEIGIGDETISIENTEIGDVLLLNTSFGAKINNFDPSMLNIGDSIYFTNDPPTISIVLESSNTSNPITSVAFSNLTRMNCNYSSKTGTVYAHITSTGSPFTYGTASQKTAGVTITVTFRSGQTTSFTFTYSVQYDGAGTISIQEGWMDYDITKLKRQVWARGCEIRGYSTKVQAAQPLYIDLDLGEAYGDIDGAMTSMNNIIQMPSKLPTLKSGANTITADNTVTDLKVIPRWWKI